MDYVVGIDLGTTHCTVACSRIARPGVRPFPIPHLVAPGEVDATELLPSFLYLPAPGEIAVAQRTLPWGPTDPVVGAWARQLGARAPNRLIASSKSWICHGGVNRRARILPWSAPDDEPHLSPFEASSRLLAHLRAAWDAAHPEATLAAQDVVVTVPASFDEVARELTADAARLAGLPKVRLIEEPQAALYDFLGAHEADLGAVLGEARLALVVDVGGGTTDLTLVRIHEVREPGGTPEIERIAVGGHLMLGGDNMDAALAYFAQREAGLEGKLDPTEWSALLLEASRAKERLLGAEAPDEAVISIQRRGSRLVGGTKSQEVRRDDVGRLLIDGFFPRTGPSEVPARSPRAGLTQLGLPYETDPAVPRHVCAFLRRHVVAATAAGAEVLEGLPRPDLLLLNGGVFEAAALARRFTEVLDGWYGEPVRRLPHTSLDTAVARGAVRFGLAGHGVGLLITGGAARAHYIGVDDAGGRQRALCVAPRGMAEGARVDLRDRVFELTLGRRVSFPLYSTTVDRGDAPGQLVEVDDTLESLPPIATAFASRTELWRASSESGVPVTLSAERADTGTLALSLVTVELPPHRWRLAFDLGAEAAPGRGPAVPMAAPDASAEPLPERFGEAAYRLARVFGTDRKGADPRAAKGLRQDVEALVGPRGPWSSTLCRAVADRCLGLAEHRGRSEEHELSWLRLVGWGLRPGTGAPGDVERVATLLGLPEGGPARSESKACWAEWWILWRRVASGLDAATQRALFAQVLPWLDPSSGPAPPGPRPGGLREMMLMLGAFERLTAAEKAIAGGICLDRFKKLGSWWALGRLGSRQPLCGGSAEVVGVAVAGGWLERVLAADWDAATGAPFAAVLLATRTGDPGRDVDDALRRKVLRRLDAVGASPHWVGRVRDGAALAERDVDQLYGDAPPRGLRLTR